VIVLALDARLIPAPATSDTLLELPFREKLVPPGFGPTIVIELAPALRVILLPATRDALPVEALRLKRSEDPITPKTGVSTVTS